MAQATAHSASINPSQSAGMSKRLTWLDAARGIGILLVVLGHVERGLVASGIAKGGAWELFDTALYTFHMPLFMLLAGINVPGSLAKGTSRFLGDKVRSIAYPYVLWSLIQGSILVLLSKFTNGGATWHDVAQIGWKPMSQFWFLYALMAYMALSALCNARLAFLGPISIISLILATKFSGEGIVHHLLFSLPFFTLGIFLSDYLKSFHVRHTIVWLVLLACVFPLAFQLVPIAGSTPYMTLRAVPCTCIGITFVLIISQNLTGLVQTVFEKLGVWSMSIYVMHILAASGARIVLLKMGADLPPAFYLIFGTIVGLAAPSFAHMVFERAGVLPLLGLGKRQNGGRIIPDRVTGEESMPSA